MSENDRPYGYPDWDHDIFAGLDETDMRDCFVDYDWMEENARKTIAAKKLIGKATNRWTYKRRKAQMLASRLENPSWKNKYYDSKMNARPWSAHYMAAHGLGEWIVDEYYPASDRNIRHRTRANIFLRDPHYERSYAYDYNEPWWQKEADARKKGRKIQVSKRKWD